MSWSKRYMQKKISTHTGGDVLTEPTKPGFVSFGSTGSPEPVGKKSGDAPCPTCGCGSFWRGDSGGWYCEQCTPPGNEHVGTWRNFSGAKLPQAPPPAMAWPDDLSAMLNRVASYFEWSQADRQDFIAWARRSPEGIHDAREFLMAEVAKLPAPGLSDRCRAVLDMLAADPAVNYAWTCSDDGSDAVLLTMAIRGRGTCELGIPREKFAALELPMLIDRLTQESAP